MTGWTLVAAAGQSADAGPQLLALALVTTAWVGGRLLSQLPDAVTAIGVLIAGGVAASVLGTEGGLSGGPTAGPLGYGNANGALCAVGAGAASLAALSARSRAARLLCLLGAGGLCALAVATGSQAGAAVAACLFVVALLLAWRPAVGDRLPAAAVLLVLAALGTTVLLGASGRDSGGSDSGPLGAALTDRRLELWSESMDLVVTDPTRGVGPGRFAEESPTARSDADARWAHSVWLHVAAENGIPGLVLVMVLAAAVMLRPEPNGWYDRGVPAFGSMVVAGVLVHASVDYVLHHAVVLGTVSLVAGLSADPAVNRRS